MNQDQTTHGSLLSTPSTIRVLAVVFICLLGSIGCNRSNNPEVTQFKAEAEDARAHAQSAMAEAQVNKAELAKAKHRADVAEAELAEVELAKLKAAQSLPKLEEQLSELRKQLEQATSAAFNLKSDLAEARSAIANYEERDRQRRLGGASAPKGATFSDPRGAVTVEILQILIGEQVVKNAKLHDFQLEGIREQGKDAVYFEVK